MADEETLLEVEDLYTNFYTLQGVVKALDGVSFAIKRGETFGLVGETGCGKSVTANCVLRLIPIPPGKIENGHIYFYIPEVMNARKADLQAKIEIMKAKGKGDNDPEVLSALQEISKLENISGRKNAAKQRLETLRASGRSESDPEVTELQSELAKIRKDWDLLSKSDGYMRQIRGKYISMIFQEPMSALNPVFTAGNQIAEILLLHEKRELAQATIRNMETDLKEINNYKRAGTRRTAKGELQCTNCNALMAEQAAFCPQCGGRFESDPLRGLRKARIRYHMRYYRMIIKKPTALSLRVASKIPIIRGYEKPIKAEAMQRAERMLRLVRIPDPKNVVSSYPHELSGGMQQRVMIAMALACRPKMLIADEPTTALDVTIQAQILKLMRDLQEETGTSILLITHNLGVVAETCDRVGVMYAGLMAEVGPVNSIFKEPLHPYTQGLINAIPNLAAGIERLEAIEGNVPNLVKPPPGCRFHPRCPHAMDICRREKPPVIEVRSGHFTTCHLYTEVKR